MRVGICAGRVIALTRSRNGGTTDNKKRSPRTQVAVVMVAGYESEMQFCSFLKVFLCVIGIFSS